MSNNTSIKNSGDGTRPTTSGGVDNIGGGEKFSGSHAKTGEDIAGPAPRERMADKRRSVEAAEHDDSSAFELHEDLTPEPNKEPAPPAGKKPAD